MKRTILICLLFAWVAEGKPNVLIIGDSISLGYTPFVVELLKGEANIVHNAGNAGPTQRGLENIDHWLGDEEWDVIHFNWGLWDMYHWCYWEYDQSPAAYERNLRMLVKRLKATGAKLIWGTTTPACPGPEKKQQVLVDSGLESRYLEAAERVMGEFGIEVNDLNAFMATNWSDYDLADNNVHFTQAGYQKLGELVADKIEKAL